jgi:hypothetical protein
MSVVRIKHALDELPGGGLASRAAHGYVSDHDPCLPQSVGVSWRLIKTPVGLCRSLNRPYGAAMSTVAPRPRRRRRLWLRLVFGVSLLALIAVTIFGSLNYSFHSDVPNSNSPGVSAEIWIAGIGALSALVTAASGLMLAIARVMDVRQRSGPSPNTGPGDN